MILRWLVVFLALCLELSLVQQSSAQSQGGVDKTNEQLPPNIVMLIADDLGWGDVSVHGGNIPTPQIDSLALEGMELRRYYTYPLCSPSQVALLTGMMPKRFGIVHALQARDEGMPAGLPTLPRTLQSAGYQTFAVGKWHIGNVSPPLKSGFDHFYGFLGPEIDYFRHTNRNGKVDWQRDEVTLQEEGYSTQLLANEASRLIENRDVKRPFHLHVAFNAPHFPLAAPPDYVKNYPYLSPAEAVRAAVIEALDDAVGQILNTLDKNGLRDNTLVVFLSDNGADQTGRNTPLRGNKSSVYEGGIRVPCFLRWPQKLASRSYCDQPICAQDIYPTLVHAVNITMRDQAKLDGTSQWSAIENGLEQERECFSIAMNDTALFDGPWKLIEFSTGERSLFHIVNDSEEYQDLAKQEVDTVERLVAKLRDQQLQFPKSPNQARRRPPPRVRQ